MGDCEVDLGMGLEGVHFTLAHLPWVGTQLLDLS